MEKWSFPIIVIGSIVLSISLFADFIGIGSFEGFGYKQIIGTSIGLLIIAIGLIMRFMRNVYINELKGRISSYYQQVFQSKFNNDEDPSQKPEFLNIIPNSMNSGSITRNELVWGFVVLGISLSARAIFITVFPTRAMIDAYEIIEFSRRFIDGSALDHSTKSLWLWAHWNPGLPLFLSPFIAFFGATELLIASTARWTLSMPCGMITLIPFLILRDVMSLRARVIISLLLSLWPGQIIFGGVILTDNLVMLPTIALACFTIRAGVLRTCYPIWSGAIFALAVCIRQETLITNIPLLIVPLGFTPLTINSRRRLFLGGAIILSFLVALAIVRWEATDRFAITTTHTGTSLLGAFSPGAHLTGYIDYQAFASTFDSIITDDDALRLAFKEALNRPGFHIIRIIGSIIYHLKVGDGDTWWTFGNLSNADKGTGSVSEELPWSVLDDSKIIPSKRQSIAKKVSNVFTKVVKVYQPILYVLFFTCMVVTINKGWWAITLVGLGSVIRVIFHGLTVIQPRFLLVGTALEAIVIVQTINLFGKNRKGWRLVGSSLLVGLMFVGIINWSEPYFWSYVIRHDKLQRTYKFALTAYRHTPSIDGSWIAGKMRCMVNEGTVQYLNEAQAQLRLLKDDPSPGDRAIANCMFEPYLSGSYSLVVKDSSHKGGSSDKVVL